MTPRSLVGMTMSSRKRAARKSLAMPDGHASDSPFWRAAYAEARRLYRIGQRLRPCSCCDCQGWRRFWLCGEFVHMHPAMRSASYRDRPECHGPHCSGSGVRPARRP